MLWNFICKHTIIITIQVQVAFNYGYMRKCVVYILIGNYRCVREQIYIPTLYKHKLGLIGVCNIEIKLLTRRSRDSNFQKAYSI